MLEGLSIETAMFLLILWLASTVVAWVFIIPYFFRRYVKQTIVRMLADQDDETRGAIAALAAALLPVLLNCRLKTGKTLKDEDGKEYDEEVTLFTFAGRELSRHLLMKMKAARGGMTTQAGAKLEEALEADPSLASLVGGFGPRKGQTTQEYLMEQLMSRLMPSIEKKITEKLNGTQGYNQF